MGNREEELKSRIEQRYGSIPKFCDVSGLAKSTVYNIFDRGVENTRTKTMDIVYYYLDMSGERDVEQLGDDERELVELFRRMNGRQRAALLDTARAMVG